MLHSTSMLLYLTVASSSWNAIYQVSSFTYTVPSFFGINKNHPSSCVASSDQLFSSSGDDDNTTGSNNNSELDALRMMLESSWNVDTMGKIPSDPTDSADEAVTAINSAKANGVNIFFVDLLLPSYDIKQGHTLYDEVLAVEYCIEISNLLKGNSSILVRNGITLESVGRVIEAREREKRREQERLVPDSSNVRSSSSMDFSSDEKDLEDKEDEEEIPDSSDSDLDAFRQQLMSTWDAAPLAGGDSSGDPIQSDEVPSSGEASIPMEEMIRKTDDVTQIESNDDMNDNREDRKYRLASLFGDSKISNGANMMDDIVQSLRLNALPKADEENIIVLSAVSREEMVAVRILAEKYEGTKNIILLNCKLDPIPNELRRGETVYSISPLIARKKDTSTASRGDESEESPKVVVMRRYPSDWEVYVDVRGVGFQLAETAPAVNTRVARGPPMDWVVSSVQRYLRRNG